MIRPYIMQNMTIIDELKELSSYLTEIESELTTFFNISLDLLCISDINGKILKISPSCVTVLGYQQDELIKQSFLNLTHPDDKNIVTDTMKQLRYADVPKIVIRTRTKYGTYRLISWAAAKEINGKIYSVGRDVTDVYHHQEDLENKIKELELKIKELEGK